MDDETTSQSDDYDSDLDSELAQPPQNDTKINSLTCPHPGCGRTLSRPDRLRNHLKLHSGEKPFSCDAPGCSLSYATDRALRRHQKEKHQNVDDEEGEMDEFGNVIPKIPKLLKCPREDCSATFAYEQSVVRHVRHVHERPPKYITCTVCEAKFKKHNKLKEHMYVHNGEKAFSCEHPGCGKKFSRLSHRKLHQKTHEGYACDECESAEHSKFASWSELVAHKKEKHSKKKERECRYTCQESNCNKAYTRSKYLRQHVARFHRGERETCPHCERKLSTAQKLRLHIAMYHEGDNPKPLPPPKKPALTPRPKKLTPEEKERRKLEKLAERLSGFRRKPAAATAKEEGAKVKNSSDDDDAAEVVVESSIMDDESAIRVNQ